MTPIRTETVLQIINEFVQQASLQDEMNELDQHQPEVLRYSMLTLDGHRAEAGMRACHLGWCVYRAFRLQADGPLPQLSLVELATKARLNEGLSTSAGTKSLDTFRSVMSLEMANQPVVLDIVRRSVADVLIDDHEQNRNLVHQVFAIFLAVKTVVDVLDSATDSVYLQFDRN